MLKCNACGNTEKFYGEQRVWGTVTVVVDNDGEFLQNDTEDGLIDSTHLECANPEGPFVCAMCESEDVSWADKKD
jgi:hypothetical protein